MRALKKIWRWMKLLIRWKNEADHYVVPDEIVRNTPWGTFKVPRGFIFDGATGVPNICMQACASHDWLYLTGEIEGKPIRRWMADEIYHLMLEESGNPDIADLYLGGLNYLGGPGWHEHRKNDTYGQARIDARILEDPDKWEIPSWYLDDARRMER